MDLRARSPVTARPIAEHRPRHAAEVPERRGKAFAALVSLLAQERFD
jgi:hypothetical protein